MEAIPTGQASNRPAQGKSANKTKAAAKSRQGETRAEPMDAALDPNEIKHTIATTAYFLAAARNFEPGHELQDWLEAERRVRSAIQ
jgi:hypothetical protein